MGARVPGWWIGETEKGGGPPLVGLDADGSKRPACVKLPSVREEPTTRGEEESPAADSAEGVAAAGAAAETAEALQKELKREREEHLEAQQQAKELELEKEEAHRRAERLELALSEAQQETQRLRTGLEAERPDEGWRRLFGEGNIRDGESQTNMLQMWIAFAALYITAFAAVVAAGEFRAHFAYAFGGALVALIIGSAALRTPTLSRRTKLLAWAIVVFVVLVAGSSLVRGIQLWSHVDNEQQIREVILQGTQHELDWYKNPTSDQAPVLERFFLPGTPKGPEWPSGARLPEISNIVTGFQDKGRRYADTASSALFFSQISVLPDGQTANVETSEIWYQPLVEQQGGEEVAVDQPAEQLNLYTDKQFYVLRKVEGQWYIESNPAPVSPSSQ